MIKIISYRNSINCDKDVTQKNIFLVEEITKLY